MDKAVTIASPAKVNLYLEILNKRPDGYHAIVTLFERISLSDEIILRPREDSALLILSKAKNIPLDSNNLVYKAAALLRKDLGISRGVSIEIKKRIPVGAGLGGGSSNAASTLLGLNRLWNLKLSKKKLLAYAARLGSDVAFFIEDVSFAWGSSRGEKITPCFGAHKSLWHILLTPDVSVSTKEAYQEFDRVVNKPPLSHAALEGSGFPARRLRVGKILFNHLEDVTFRKYPKVRKLKESLRAYGVRRALMSGSGGSVFGIVKSRKEGLRIAERFQHRKGLKVFVVKTM